MTEFIITCDSELKPDGSYDVKRFRELVRCKDCKHVCLCDTEELFPDMPVYAKCTLTDEVHEPDWFCADGERS